MNQLKELLHQTHDRYLKEIQCWEEGFELTYSPKNTLYFWEPYYGEVDQEVFDSFALGSYVSALMDGWDPQTPLPDDYELYDDLAKQPLYFKHLEEKGIVYLKTLRVEQQEARIHLTYEFVQQIDPFGDKIEKFHHQRCLRLDLERKIVEQSIPFEQEGAWQPVERERYLVMKDHESKLEQAHLKFRALTSLTYFDFKATTAYQGLSYFIRQFHLKKYPLPSKAQSLFDLTMRETLVECLRQIHLVHYQKSTLTPVVLDEWVLKTPSELLKMHQLKPNRVFQTLIAKSLDFLPLIRQLQQKGFSTHQIHLLLDQAPTSVAHLIEIFDYPWVQRLLAIQGKKRFCRHWFQTGTRVKLLMTDIQKTYQELRENVDSEVFEQLQNQWNYQLNFENFEEQLLEDWFLHDRSPETNAVFNFKTAWIRSILQSDGLLMSKGQFQLTLPQTYKELMFEGKKYRMCFKSYLPSIEEEKQLIFFIRNQKNRLQGALRLKRIENEWVIQELKQTYNRKPTPEMIDWVRSIAFNQGWEWDCPDVPSCLNNQRCA